MSNPYIEQRNCYSDIDKLIMSLKHGKTLDVNDFLIQILVKYAVSETSIMKFLKKYEDSSVIKIEEGTIIRNEV